MAASHRNIFCVTFPRFPRFVALLNMKTFCVTLLLCAAASAQIPDAPEPKHPFFDNQNLASLSASFVAKTADTVNTCNFLHHAIVVPTTTVQVGPGVFMGTGGGITHQHEVFAPVGTCGGIIAWNGGWFLGAAGSSYLLHRSGHHFLERLPNWISAAASVAGIVYTATHRHVPPSASQHSPNCRIGVFCNP